MRRMQLSRPTVAETATRCHQRPVSGQLSMLISFSSSRGEQRGKIINRKKIAYDLSISVAASALFAGITTVWTNWSIVVHNSAALQRAAGDWTSLTPTMYGVITLLLIIASLTTLTFCCSYAALGIVSSTRTLS